MQDFSQEQKEFIENLFSKLNTNINEKSSEIREELKKQINDLKADVISTTNNLEKKIIELEAENKTLKQNVIHLERRVRKNNLIIFGISVEEPNLTTSVLKIFNDIGVTIEVGDLNDVYRITTTNSNPVVVEFISYQQKLLVLKNVHKLKGKNIFVAKDLSIEDRKKNKILLHHQKQARAKGELAYIKGEKLYIGNQPYTINQLENPETDDDQENPQEEKANSAPSTPCHFTQTKEINREKGIEQAEENQIKNKFVQKTKIKNDKEKESSATRYTRAHSKNV